MMVAAKAMMTRISMKAGPRSRLDPMICHYGRMVHECMAERAFLLGLTIGVRQPGGRMLNRWKIALTVAIALTSSSCIAAAAAAGAGTAVYVTSRGAEAVLEGAPADLESRVLTALREHDVSVSGSATEDGGDKRTWTGRAGDINVDVSAERQSPSTTKLEVTARRNLADWEKEFAERVLRSIVTGD